MATDLYTICRTCFQIVDANYQYIDESLNNAEDSNIAGVNIRDMLQFCVPEMDLYVSSQPVICHACSNNLWNFYMFKKKCLGSETKIQTYLKCHNLMDYNQVNLNLVRRFEHVTSVGGGGGMEVLSERKMEQCRKSPSVVPTPTLTTTPNSNMDILLSCRYCPYVTTQPTNLTQHICENQNQKQTNPQIHRCNFCSYTSTKAYSLKSHINNVHTKSQWYQCEHCAYKSTDQSCLRRHRRTNHLAASAATTHGVYQCSQCSYKAYNEVMFQRHVERHNRTMEIFKCQYCQYQSMDKSNFKKHVYIHADSYALCKICQYQCVSPYQMRKHLRRAHADWGNCASFLVMPSKGESERENVGEGGVEPVK